MRCKCCNRILLSLVWSKEIGDWEDCTLCKKFRKDFRNSKRSTTDGLPMYPFDYDLYYEWGSDYETPEGFKIYKE